MDLKPFAGLWGNTWNLDPSKDGVLGGNRLQSKLKLAGCTSPRQRFQASSTRLPSARPYIGVQKFADMLEVRLSELLHQKGSGKAVYGSRRGVARDKQNGDRGHPLPQVLSPVVSSHPGILTSVITSRTLTWSNTSRASAPFSAVITR